jgi:hypothetical protein
MKVEKIIYSVIITVVILTVAQALYPTMSAIITNITGSGYAGIGILTVLTVLYWILISAGLVLYWVKSFGIGGKY